MNQRVAHINLDAANTLVVPTPRRLCFRVPLPESLQGDMKYQLYQGGETYEGYLNGNGEADVLLKTSTGESKLQVWVFGEDADPFEWQLSLGELPDIETLQGVQSRLNNLGHDAGVVDGIMGKQTRAATKKFQQKHLLTVDGEPGDKTKKMLVKVYGC